MLNNFENKVSFIKKCKYVFSNKQICRFFGVSLLLIIKSLLETAAVALMYPFVYLIMGTENMDDNRWMRLLYDIFDCESSADLIVVMSFLLAGIYLFKAAFACGCSWIQQTVLAKARCSLSSRIFDCILHKPYAYHLENDLAVMNRSTNEDVAKLFGLANAIFSIFAEIVTAIMLLAVLLATDVTITLISLVLMVLLTFGINAAIKKRTERAGKDDTKHHTTMTKWLNQAKGGLKGINVNHRQQMFVNKFTNSASMRANASRRYAVYGSLPDALIESFCMGAVFVYVGILMLKDNSAFEMLPVFATFALAATRLMPVAKRVASAFNTISYNKVGLDMVYKTLSESKVDVNDGYNTVKPERPVPVTEALKIGIEVKNISFRYDDADYDLFHDLSLSIPAGKSVAFVGTTGSGKTTLADIILGLHNVQEGEILVDGKNIKENSDWWADRVGYIPQYIYLSDDTIRNNIAYGIAPEKIDDEKVWKCLEDAQVKEFVESLPEGLDTVTGENGVRLSGGQRQRLGIARALYTDPPFIVMDEATSALDNATERAIVESIDKLSGSKTMLIIAHRLSTIKNCNIIYKFDQGKVTQENI